jgi:hypothetical protein
MKGLDYPVVGELLKRRIRPGESYPFWEHHCKGFSAPYRDLVAADVTDKTKKHVPRTMSRILTEKRDRLLLKITGWPRIGFLSEVFERLLLAGLGWPTKLGVGSAIARPKKRVGRARPIVRCSRGYSVEDLDGRYGEGKERGKQRTILRDQI